MAEYHESDFSYNSINSFIDAQGRAETKVDVIGISSNALKGLYQALDRQARLIADLTKGIADVNEGIELLADDANKSADEQNKANVGAERANKANEEARMKAEAEARKQFLSEQNRDIANARRSRAASAAVYDKVDKVLSATDILKNTLKDIGNKIFGMLGNMAKNTLKSYDDAVRGMRNLDLTTKQIKENTLKADNAKLYLSKMGYKVSSSISRSVSEELSSLGEDTSTFTDAQMASLTMAKRQGLDIRNMIGVVRSTKDQDKLIKVIANMSDPASKEAMVKLSSQIGESWFKLYAQKAKGGDSSAALEELSNYVKSIDSVLPGLNAESKNSMAETYAKISTGQYEDLKNYFNNLIPTGAWEDPSKFAESIENYIKSTDKSSDDKMNELRVLLNAAQKPENGLDPKFIESLMSAVQYEQAGNYKKKTIRTEEETKEAINQHQPGGKVGGAVDTVLTKLNVLTGGVFSGMSAGLNEMFGDQADMSTVVSKGFTVVCGLLASIVASKIIGNPLSLLTKVVGGSGLLIKLKDLFKGKGKGDGSDDSRPKPEDIVNPKPKPKPEDIVNPKPKPKHKPKPEDIVNPKPKPAPRDIDSEYKEAVKKIKEDVSKALKGIKSIPGIAKQEFTNMASRSVIAISKVPDAFSAVKNRAKDAFSSFKTSMNSAFKSMKESSKSAFKSMKESSKSAFKSMKESSKSAFKSMKESSKSAFKSMKESAKSAFKKLPGALKGSAGKIGKIGKGALAGIGIASGALGLLGATGAFDSLTPILEDFSKTIAPVLSDAVKTLAPTIQMLLQSLTPVLQDIITVLAPILDGVLKAITPIIISLVNSLVPVLNSLFTTLTPILNTITNTLTPIIDMLVQTVMPVVTTILDVLTPIIETVLDVLTPILTSVFEVLAPVIKVIAKVTTPILKLIGNLLKGISPVLEMALKPLVWSLELIKPVLDRIADFLPKDNKPADNRELVKISTKAREEDNKELEQAANILSVANINGLDYNAKDKTNAEIIADAQKVEQDYEARFQEYDGGILKFLHELPEPVKLATTMINPLFGIAMKSAIDPYADGLEAQREMLNIAKSGSFINVQKAAAAQFDSAVDADKTIFGNDDFNGTDIGDLKKMADSDVLNSLENIFTDQDILIGRIKKLYEDDSETADRLIKLHNDKKTKALENPKPYGNGVIVNSPTNAIIGEAGKEVVLPLTRPDRIVELLKQLTSNEKLLLIRSLIKENSLIKALSSVLHLNDNINGTIATTNAIDLATKNTAEQNKKKLEDIELAEGSVIAENMIIGASKQTGKKYAEIVCNQLVEAAMKWAGFTPPTTGPVFKHFNHPNMHLVLNDPEKGISPNDPKLKPGMILFSHPFTQAEADELNRTKGKGRKSGDPGHMGIYAGNGLWWNSTSSKNTTDYSSGKGVKVTDNNKGFGVALTKPFTTGTYKLYAAGYYDGMFDAASVKGLPETSHKELKDDSTNSTENTSTNINPAYSSVKNAGLFTDEELANIATQAGVNNSQTMSEFIKQAGIALNGNSSSREDIIAILIEIARYLKGAIQSKQPMMSVTRPPAKVYS